MIELAANYPLWVALSLLYVIIGLVLLRFLWRLAAHCIRSCPDLWDNTRGGPQEVGVDGKNSKSGLPVH